MKVNDNYEGCVNEKSGNKKKCKYVNKRDKKWKNVAYCMDNSSSGK